MSKLNATRAFLGILALCCLPLSAATISSDDAIQMRLSFDAIAVGPNQYEVPAGGVVRMDVFSAPGDLLWIFAVAEDTWGEPDYSNIITLFLDQSRGSLTAYLEIPASLVGMTFHLQAVGQSLEKGALPIPGPEIEVAVTGQLVLMPSQDE
jgi:hypothetical protein